MSTASTEPNLCLNRSYRRAPWIAATALVVATGGDATAMQQQAPACVAGGVPFRTAITEVHELQSNVGYAAAVMLDGQVVESVVGGMADLENRRSQRAVEKLGASRVGQRPDAGGRDSYVYEIAASAFAQR